MIHRTPIWTSALIQLFHLTMERSFKRMKNVPLVEFLTKAPTLSLLFTTILKNFDSDLESNFVPNYLLQFILVILSELTPSLDCQVKSSEELHSEFVQPILQIMCQSKHFLIRESSAKAFRLFLFKKNVFEYSTWLFAKIKYSENQNQIHGCLKGLHYILERCEEQGWEDEKQLIQLDLNQLHEHFSVLHPICRQLLDTIVS